jgi:hypothetical protein
MPAERQSLRKRSRPVVGRIEWPGKSQQEVFSMEISSEAVAEAPQAVRNTLRQLRDGLVDALGDELVALVVYGDLAKPGEFDVRNSSIEVMLVAAGVSTAVLDKASGPILKCQRGRRLSVLTVSEEDLKSSCDVFPIKFLDMQQDYHLLWGKDVLASLEISDDHLRLRCEQEIKNLMLRLRGMYLGRANRPRLLAATLTTGGTALMKPLAACMTLKTGVAPTQNHDVIQAAAAEFGLDADVLNRVLALKHESRRAAPEDLKRLYGGFMTAVEKLAREIDQMDVTG